MTDAPEPPEVAAHAARAATDADTHVLLDVRNVDEWERGHATCALHMSLSDLDVSQLDPSVPIITVCRSGGRSTKAAHALIAEGFTVSNLTGGMQRWEELGLPVVQRDGAPRRIA